MADVQASGPQQPFRSRWPRRLPLCGLAVDFPLDRITCARVEEHLIVVTAHGDFLAVAVQRAVPDPVFLSCAAAVLAVCAVRIS